jgi:excinuclease ABC subunit B
MDETNRRRAKQLAYNEANGITPESIIKPVDMSLVQVSEADYATVPLEIPDQELATREQVDAAIAELEKQMKDAAKQFEFEKAAALRDRIRALKTKEI